MTTETFGKSTRFYSRKGSAINARVEVTIDWDSLTRLMAKKAYHNNDKTSRLGVGVKVRIVDATERTTQET
jgi:hypothetical protein